MAVTILNPARFNGDGGVGGRQFIRAAFSDEGYGSSTSFFAYRRGGGIVPDTAAFSGIGLGTAGSPLRMSQFSGFVVPSLTDTQTVTIGSSSLKGTRIFFGFRLGFFGSISDGTFNLISNATISDLYYSNPGPYLEFSIVGNFPDSGWSTMVISGTTFNRTSFEHSYNSETNKTSWVNYSASNPFGAADGTVVNAVFTA
jgi:hypothetical protein